MKHREHYRREHPVAEFYRILLEMTALLSKEISDLTFGKQGVAPMTTAVLIKLRRVILMLLVSELNSAEPVIHDARCLEVCQFCGDVQIKSRVRCQLLG